MSPSFYVWALLGPLLLYSAVLGQNEPEIVTYPSDIVTVVGNDVLLECIVENLPLEDNLVQWTKDGFALGFDRSIPGFATYSMVGDVSTGQYNLKIKNASIQDEAVFECQVRVNRMRAKASVTILVPPKGPAIEKTQKDGKINVLSDSANLIRCKSWGGKPAGKLSWYMNGMKITENVTYDEIATTGGKLLNSSATLRLWPTERNDGDVYRCEMQIDGQFSETYGSELTSSATAELNVQKPPIATLMMDDTVVKEGDNIAPKCESYYSNPPATSYKWFVNGVLQKHHKDAIFPIRNINKTMNNAIIGCKAVNEIGESEISTVEMSVLYAPKLLVGPENIVTNFTAFVNMSCVWESNPPAIITWYKKGTKNIIVGDGEKLLIRAEDQSASGTYVCVADALGVASESAEARLDVLGPPIIDSPAVQRVSTGSRATINCTLGSTPGISRVVWTWNSKGNVISIVNNATKKVRGKLKYTGVMSFGSSKASLVIEDVKKDDFIEYNCTVRNSFGESTIVMNLEEQVVAASSMTMTVTGAIIAGTCLLIITVVLAIFCIRRKRQEKSTTFPPEKESLHMEEADHPRQDNRMDQSLPAKKLINPDADSDNPSSSASVASHDVVGEHLEEIRNSAHNDDGYHTEEANSWNRNEKQSPSSSPARSGREEHPPRGSIVTSMPIASSPIHLERAASPYAASDVASDITNTGYLRYNTQPQGYPQYPAQYELNGVVDLPPVARAASPLTMYGVPAPQPLPPNYYQGPSSTLSYRNAPQAYPLGSQRSRAGSNAPSVVSSHRSVTPSPYILGRATPTSVLMDKGMYPVPITAQSQMHPSSSQSSLDQVAPSPAIKDPYENPSQMSRLNSIVSQASRSSEMLNKPMTARMATHV